MASYLQRARDVDAGQVGISLVCILGPRFSLYSAGLGRSPVRQGAARYHRARMVPASKWADSRLRMELRRCQSAGAGLGGVARLADRAETDRQRRSRVAVDSLPLDAD